MSKTIAPKSDQLNGEDLMITGPRTVKITSVTENSSEQPISIHYEGENGRPFKPCKTMRALMTAVWGIKDARKSHETYPGRFLTLYYDPDVRYGKTVPGGVRISHMSGIDREQHVSLTEAQGRKRTYTVLPIVKTMERPPQPSPSPGFAEATIPATAPPPALQARITKVTDKLAEAADRAEVEAVESNSAKLITDLESAGFAESAESLKASIEAKKIQLEAV